jgi:tetratricopeptide (TPR) repeat protein
MAKNEDGVQLGRAWALHRENRNDQAISEFNQMLQGASENIDALYGLGLSQRAAHQPDAAKQSFERCLALVNQELAQNPSQDRFQMLQRFIHQRLAEMGV